MPAESRGPCSFGSAVHLLYLCHMVRFVLFHTDLVARTVVTTLNSVAECEAHAETLVPGLSWLVPGVIPGALQSAVRSAVPLTYFGIEETERMPRRPWPGRRHHLPS